MSGKASKHWKLASLAAVMLAVLWTWWVFDWNWFKPLIEQRVSAATGRTLEIGGDFSVALRWHPRLRMDTLRFANPEWATHPQMIEAERVEFTLRLLPLWQGRLEFPEVVLTRASVALERNAKGQNNWSFSNPEDNGGEPPKIGLLTVDRGLLHFNDAMSNSYVRLEVNTRSTEKQERVHVTGSGKLKGMAFTTRAIGGPILAIEDTHHPYPLDLELQTGQTSGRLRGTVTGLAAQKAIDAQLDLQGDSLSKLYPILGLAAPPTPPYRIQGRLLHDGNDWKLHGFKGRLGDSDLSGDVDITDRVGRLFLQARLVSAVLDVDDLMPMIGAPPQVGAGETASREQRQQAAQVAASPRLLPDMPLELERLRAMDMDVRFDGKSIRSPRTPIENLKSHIKIDNGVLRAYPLDLGVAGGHITSAITLDGTRDMPQVDADIQFKALHLRRLVPDKGILASGEGLIGGRAQLRGRGKSMAQVLGTADGQFGLAMRGGRVSNLVLELVGLDAAETVKYLFAGDREVGLRCAVADFDLQQGQLQTRAFVVDTTDTNINIVGGINLRDETLDLQLRPLPKDFSPLTLRSPLHATGPIKSPKIRPGKNMLLRGGIAALLGALASPLAALLPLIETGPGKNADCQGLIGAVESHAKTRIPPATPR